jgi:hypothetical protein
MREQIERRLGDVGLSSALRDSTLRALGRDDLVLEGRDESGHRGRKRRPDAEWTVIPVKMTPAQKAAIRAAAKAINVATSYLMVDALTAELDVKPRQPSAKTRGNTLGVRRRSDRPKKR